MRHFSLPSDWTTKLLLETSMNITPIHVEQTGSVVCVGTSDNQNMEQLMTVASKIKETRFPAFGNSRNINYDPNRVKECHTNFIPERFNANRLMVEKYDFVCSRYDSRKGHACKSYGTHWSVLGCLEHRDKGHNQCCNSNQWNPSQIDVSPHGLAEEYVVHRGKETGCNHDSNSSIVKAP